MSKELEKLLIKEARDKASVDINSIFSNITVPDINNLPEEIFVQTFLPLFHGDINDIGVITKLTQDWLYIAGGPSQEVAIINNKGEELYKVPPIFNSSAISVTEKGRRSIAEIITNSETDDFKPRANLQLRADLDLRQKELLIRLDEARDKVINNLNNIFSRYNLSKFEDTTKKNEVKNITDDDIVFEDD